MSFLRSMHMTSLACNGRKLVWLISAKKTLPKRNAISCEYHVNEIVSTDDWLRVLASTAVTCAYTFIMVANNAYFVGSATLHKWGVKRKFQYGLNIFANILEIWDIHLPVYLYGMCNYCNFVYCNVCRQIFTDVFQLLDLIFWNSC